MYFAYTSNRRRKEPDNNFRCFFHSIVTQYDVVDGFKYVPALEVQIMALSITVNEHGLRLSTGKATTVAVPDKDLIPVIPATGKEMS